MSKTILAKVDGFTPVIDSVLADAGLLASVVFGKVWRYCQMEDGVCTASQERIAQELGISRKTVNVCIGKLVDAGYLVDKTPDLIGQPHVYADSGKAGMSISISATASQTAQPVTESYRGCNRKLQPPVTESYTKKQLKKQLRNNDDDEGKIFRLYEETIGVITPLIADSLADAAKEYPLEWIEKAFRTAAENNARSWRYVSACLRNWEAKGINWKPNKPGQAAPEPTPELPPETETEEVLYVPCPPELELPGSA